MKKNRIFGFLVFVITATVLLATSCKKPAVHSIRVNNSSSLAFQSIKVEGSAVVFADVKANSVSEYKSIPEGSYSLSGDLNINGTFDISGTGTHKWSIKIVKSGEISVVED